MLPGLPRAGVMGWAAFNMCSGGSFCDGFWGHLLAALLVGGIASLLAFAVMQLLLPGLLEHAAHVSREGGRREGGCACCLRCQLCLPLSGSMRCCCWFPSWYCRQ